MITYLYWLLVLVVAIGVGGGLGYVYKWSWGLVLGLLIFIVGWSAYHFKYEQQFVKNYGGVMSISAPEGRIHLHSTWKDDHLWIENYNPHNNTCYFSEYSKGHVLQGEVQIENCNPIGVQQKN